MAIFSQNLFYNLSGIIVTVIIIAIIYFKYKFKYWSKQGLYSPPTTILFGNVKAMLTLKLSLGEQVKEYYTDFRSKGLKHGGLYFSAIPVYLPVDINLLKNILQRDFEYFVNRGFYHNEAIDPLSINLFSLEDTKWKNLRPKLTPTFTPNRIKIMFDTIVDLTKALTNLIDRESINNPAIEIKEVSGRFTTDVIGSYAFGFDCNCLNNPNNAFRFYGKRAFENTTWEAILTNLEYVLPKSVLRFFNYKVTKQDVEDFFMKLVKYTVKYRERNHVFRRDFVHLLLQMKTDDQFEDEGNEFKMRKLTMNEIAAQCFIFFLAGFETSSAAITFALFELSMNQEIQDKAREEINKVLKKRGGKLTYEACNEMNYLEKVINETLRKYPPFPIIPRVCTKDYVVPDTSVCIKKGVPVAIPILALHYDAEYYPDPEKFDPERFNEENKRQRPAFSWIPFGEGPRMCIGFRFALIQMKVCLITLLKNYNIHLNEKTVLPLVYDKKTFLTASKNGIYLTFNKIA